MNWTTEEKVLLNQIWATESKTSILEQIPRSWKAIRRQAEHLHLKRLRGPYGDQYKKGSVEGSVPSWLIGEMLSDGHVDRGGRYAHTTKHEQYAQFLNKKFESISVTTKCYPNRYFDVRTKKYYSRYLLRTRSIFKSLRQQWYQPTKIVPNDIRINDEVFHHWIMGDGSIVGGTFRLATMGFSDESLLVLLKALSEYGLQTTIQSPGNIYVRRIDKNKKVLNNLTKLDWTCYDYKRKQLKGWIA